MKATYKRYLAAAFATVGLFSLGVCQPDPDAMGPTQQSVASPAQPSTTDLGATANGTQMTLDTSNVPQIMINQTQVNFTEAQPGMINGQLMVPVRAVAEQLGATVQWVDQDKQVVIDLPSEKTVTLDTNRDWLALANPDGQTMAERISGPDVPQNDIVLSGDEVILIGDRAYMPFDKFAAAINGSTDWDGSGTTATITVDQTTGGEDQQVPGGTGTPLDKETPPTGTTESPDGGTP